ncbi:MAG TPA: hypothetical protein VEG28_01895 [Dehalococcoidia bacterium]|nr:hypothetical protein [Dehalococcoidia bacterium]
MNRLVTVVIAVGAVVGAVGMGMGNTLETTIGFAVFAIGVILSRLKVGD